ncbi:conserved hypothetical protein [Xenorhabdus bovienii str. Jollieti]|uniref:DUF4123 domain-containing protein n=1 Tax=Xenorhabdus bovienii (strain SS-2004) TaxID=406818 RepID=D3UXB5_XENBS|nr:DUF4123 domain-containing protein [Xenorhabdus bovienii]CBJ80227.1 conserved hypothetical protein [Xenorhabdus bovienii SS-2004]CDH29935.1 conserved hypothetical protein [Xenorhabdus bovienii str. Jollieti]
MTVCWITWLHAQEKAPIFFIVNQLAIPNPVDTFYANGWVEQAFPLYNGTPLAHLMEQGPWLIQPTADSLVPLGRLLDRHALSDSSWGWAYRSDATWQAQLHHWKRHQLATLRGESVVFRLMDTRIARTLMPAMQPTDWTSLLNPVTELMLDLLVPTVFSRPADCPPSLVERPFVLEPHLIAAWEQSDLALEGYADTLTYELWEAQGALALQLDTPNGALQQRLTQWLTQRSRQGSRLQALTLRDFLADSGLDTLRA